MQRRRRNTDEEKRNTPRKLHKKIQRECEDTSGYVHWGTKLFTVKPEPPTLSGNTAGASSSTTPQTHGSPTRVVSSHPERITSPPDPSSSRAAHPHLPYHEYKAVPLHWELLSLPDPAYDPPGPSYVSTGDKVPESLQGLAGGRSGRRNSPFKNWASILTAFLGPLRARSCVPEPGNVNKIHDDVHLRSRSEPARPKPSILTFPVYPQEHRVEMQFDPPLGYGTHPVHSNSFSGVHSGPYDGLPSRSQHDVSVAPAARTGIALGASTPVGPADAYQHVPRGSAWRTTQDYYGPRTALPYAPAPNAQLQPVYPMDTTGSAGPFRLSESPPPFVRASTASPTIPQYQVNNSAVDDGAPRFYSNTAASAPYRTGRYA